MYSQRQTSVMMSMSGNSRFRLRTAFCTGPFGAYAPEAFSSLLSGMPNNKRLRTPARKACSASLVSSSTDNWKTPGIEETGCRAFLPGRTKSGSTRWEELNCVSATRRRKAADWRRRLGRKLGNCPRDSGFIACGTVAKDGFYHNRDVPGVMMNDEAPNDERND